MQHRKGDGPKTSDEVEVEIEVGDVVLKQEKKPSSCFDWNTKF